jgi:hypothetical protein
MIKVSFVTNSHRRSMRKGVLIWLLLQVALLAALVTNHANATTPRSLSSASATLGVRQFYLTKTTFQAGGARTACAKGYHLASIWEIADPSALEYNTVLGQTGSDCGEGPPTQIWFFGGSSVALGWIRTGYTTSSVDTVGQANCSGWSTSDGLAWGTVANLPSDWTGAEQDVGVWNTEVATCSSTLRVWCVQDDSVWQVLLPLILKD